MSKELYPRRLPTGERQIAQRAVIDLQALQQQAIVVEQLPYPRSRGAVRSRELSEVQQAFFQAQQTRRSFWGRLLGR